MAFLHKNKNLEIIDILIYIFIKIVLIKSTHIFIIKVIIYTNNLIKAHLLSFFYEGGDRFLIL